MLCITRTSFSHRVYVDSSIFYTLSWRGDFRQMLRMQRRFYR
jgi:hypothetical protein